MPISQIYHFTIGVVIVFVAGLVIAKKLGTKSNIGKRSNKKKNKKR